MSQQNMRSEVSSRRSMGTSPSNSPEFVQENGQSNSHAESHSSNAQHFKDDTDEDDEEDNEEEEDDDYIARYHDDKLEIEENWLAWERQSTRRNPGSVAAARRNNGGPVAASSLTSAAIARAKERRLHQQQLSGAPSHVPEEFDVYMVAGSSSSRPTQSPTAAAKKRLRNLGGSGKISAAALVDSYSNLSWAAKRAARRERLAMKSESDSGENLLGLMPIELLSHIFSHLEPSELFDVSLVCQLFYHVVNSDSCWKNAFLKFFSIGANRPLKRLDSKSWRGEYIKRTKLLRKWDKGRGSNIMFDPRIGMIHKVWAGMQEDPLGHHYRHHSNRHSGRDNGSPSEGWLLAGGMELGVVARCDPLLGKVQKDVIFPSVNQIVSSDVSVMEMDNHRVVWGLPTGQVAITILTQAATTRLFQTFVGFHQGPATCLKLVSNHLEFVLSGGMDGVVKLWDVAKGRCVKEFSIGSTLTAVDSFRPKIVSIVCDPEAYIIAGTSNGEVYIWDVNIAHIIPPFSSSWVSRGAAIPTAQGEIGGAPVNNGLHFFDQASTFSGMPRVIKVPKVAGATMGQKGIAHLQVDFGAGHGGLILAHTEDSKVVHIYSLQSLELVASLESPAHFTPITAIHWDIPVLKAAMVVSATPAVPFDTPVASASITTTATELTEPTGSATASTVTSAESATVSPAVVAANKAAMSGLVATGDQNGNICLWYIPGYLRAVGQEQYRQQQLSKGILSSASYLSATYSTSPVSTAAVGLKPTCVLKGHQTKISSLFIDRLVVVSGSIDGWVKAWNTVNGGLIRVLNSRFTRTRNNNNNNGPGAAVAAAINNNHPPAPANQDEALENDTNSCTVKCISIDSQGCRGVVSIGSLIKSWDFSNPRLGMSHTKGKQRKVGAQNQPRRAAYGSHQGLVLLGGGGIGGTKQNKVQSEIRQSVEERASLQRLEQEAKERQLAMHKRYNNLEGLNIQDEDELLEYALMLSKEGSEQIYHDQVRERDHHHHHRHETGASSSSTQWTDQDFDRILNYDHSANDGLEDTQEDALFRKAVAQSLLEMESDEEEQEAIDQGLLTPDHHHHHGHSSASSSVSANSELYLDGDEEDREAVRMVLEALEQEEREAAAITASSPGVSVTGVNDERLELNDKESWPSISGGGGSQDTASVVSETNRKTATAIGNPKPVAWSSSLPLPASVITPPPLLAAPIVQKKSWASTASSSSSASSSLAVSPSGAGLVPAKIKYYQQPTTLDDEDEDIQLARILSLSMIDK